MKLQFGNKMQAIFVSLVILTLFVGLSCVSAANVDGNGSHSSYCHPSHDKTLTMSVKYNAGTGYHWEVSPKTHGVTLMTTHYVQDHPGTVGSSGTKYYNFYKQTDDYFVELVLVSPSGKIVKVVNSDMLN